MIMRINNLYEQSIRNQEGKKINGENLEKVKEFFYLGNKRGGGTKLSLELLMLK